MDTEKEKDKSPFFLKTFSAVEKNINKGLDLINEYMPKFSAYQDLYGEMFKSFCLFVIAFSLIACIISPYGFLYACFPRPFVMGFMYLLNMDLGDWIQPTPEWGIHYITLIIYFFFVYTGLNWFEALKIDAPIHKISYIFCLSYASFFIPFELSYITLYDIFHSIPKYGHPTIWTFGTWKTPLQQILGQSVWSIDVGSMLCALGVMYIVLWDLKDKGYKLKLRFNKISAVLLGLFAFSMFLWIIIPVHTPDVHEFGTKWFPQTVHVEWGYYADYNKTHPKGEIYGAVNEYWTPNNMIKYHNHTSKLISVIFMFYTFLPRRDIK